jgi:pyroglutamyl-peptidase
MLLIGFDGYGGLATNPAEDVVRRLDGERIGGIVIAGRTLPVRLAEVGPRLAELIHELRPRAVIGLGLRPGETALGLERLAANVVDFEIADNAGLVARGAVVAGGPAAYLSTLPLGAIRDRLLAAGIPAGLSGSAGQFVCNALMYHALRLAAERAPPLPCGFIHLPYLPQQVAALMAAAREPGAAAPRQRTDLPSMALETMVEGVRLAIATTLDAASP